jgi:hypothetical protein
MEMLAMTSKSPTSPSSSRSPSEPMKSDRWECNQCGYRPIDGGHPPILTCPACKGDSPWRPVQQNDGQEASRGDR